MIMISLIINKEAYGSEIKGDRGYKKDYTPISQSCRWFEKNSSESRNLRKMIKEIEDSL